jgi:hypothetical protein
MNAMPTGTAVMYHGSIATIIDVAARSEGKLSSKGAGWYRVEIAVSGEEMEIFTGPINVIPNY